MWFCCIKIISGCTFQSSRANFIWIPEDWWWCNIWVFSRSLQAPRTAWRWSIQSSPGCKPYLIQEKSLDVFYQKVFETSIDQLNFMNLVDGEIDSDLHTFTQFIESCLMQHNHYLVLQTANYDFFLQICCQNKFSSLVKFPKELFITIHSFKNLWIWHQTYLIFPVWNLESRQIIVSLYKKNVFFGGDR